MPEKRVGLTEKLSTAADVLSLETLFPPFDPQAKLREISTGTRQARTPRPMPAVGNLLKTLRRETQHIQPGVHFREVGTVQQIGNGVARLSGLPHARIDEVVAFPTGVKGLVLNLGRRHLDIILLGPDGGIQGGDLVLGSGERLQIPVGSEMLGRVVNPLGLLLDEGPMLETAVTRYLERDAPGIVEREPINTSLHTGLKVVDALVPIGRGQRELILGDRQTGKTTLAVDTILTQADSDVFCIYVAIGQKKSSALAVIETLRKAGALAYTIVVLASSDDPPALRYLAPYAGCTVGEALMEEGHDVLVVYDDLSKHADAYRELSLLLRRPPGREAYPGDVFYLHARLLERAGKLRGESGGGSLTALPIAQTQRGNISTYIPTNLISITDGQIILDANRFNRGLKPAVHAGLSVSRVGGAAQSNAMRAVVGDLRLALAQYDEVAHFARFGTDVDATTQRQIQRGRHLQQVLTQPPYRPMPLAEQIVSLLAATEGQLDDLPLKRVLAFERALIDYCRKMEPELMDMIADSGKLETEKRSVLLEAIVVFKQNWQEEVSA